MASKTNFKRRVEAVDTPESHARQFSRKRAPSRTGTIPSAGSAPSTSLTSRIGPVSSRQYHRQPARLHAENKAPHGSGSSAAMSRHRPVSTPERLPEDQISTYDDDPEGADALDEVLMAVDLQTHDTVGCVYYVAREETLYFMEDTKGVGSDFIEALRLYVEPTTVLVPIRIHDAVLEKLRQSGGRQNNDAELDAQDGPFQLPFVLEERPSGEFKYESGRNRLVDLDLNDTGVPSVNLDRHRPSEFLGGQFEADRHQRYIYLSGLINLESRVSVGCANALLACLSRRRAAQFLPDDRAASAFFRIRCVETFTTRNTMFINTDTIASLQIVKSETHPHAHKQGATRSSGTKEGLSVYGLFHHLARTPQGRFLLRQYFLRPSLDTETLRERHDAVSVFTRPDNESLVREVSKHLGPVRNMRAVVINLRKGVSTGTGSGHGVARGVWGTLRQKFIFRALKIRDVVQKMAGGAGIAIVNKIEQNVDGQQLARLGTRICEVVDFDLSATEHRTCVLSGVDEELDNMKRTYHGMEDLLGNVARAIAEKIPAQLGQTINVVFFPQIGFLISVQRDPQTDAALYDGPQADPWERMFHTHDNVYFKSQEMQEMDSHFGDVWSEICDREIEIIHGLAENVLQYENLLTCVSDLCGELDSLLALARGALEYKLTRPQICGENVVAIRGGRHLLQELVVPSFVPNDTLLVGGRHQHSESPREHRNQTNDSDLGDDANPAEGPSMLLLTGPNFSGKSVYLKQVALIVYMAHIGSFVPADEARIGLTDKILTRVSTRETVSRLQSSFMLDLQQMALALNLATSRSLLIIDEFGKGTEPRGGAAIPCSVFEYLLSLGRHAPKVLGATHFHEIFENGFLEKSPTLSFCHMEVHIDEEQRQTEDQITYLYICRPGRTISSYGTACAALNGVDRTIVERAEELIELDARGDDLVAACSVLPEAEMTELSSAEETARTFLSKDMDDYSDPRVLLETLFLSSTGRAATGIGSPSDGDSTYFPLAVGSQSRE